jgi:hypothetical protein
LKRARTGFYPVKRFGVRFPWAHERPGAPFHVQRVGDWQVAFSMTEGCAAVLVRLTGAGGQELELEFGREDGLSLVRELLALEAKAA